jgi:hypothetical protein
MQILGKLLTSIVTGLGLTEGKNSLRCENNQIICFPRNVKARGKEVAQLQQSRNIPSHLLRLYSIE